MEVMLLPVPGYHKGDIVDVNLMQKEIEAAVDETGALVYADFLMAVSTWRHKVSFEHKGFRRGGDYVFQVYTDDEIMSYLNKGTSIRWATMWPKFQPKTVPGSIKSGHGRYPNPRLKGRKQHQVAGLPAKSGIVAREFDLSIIEKQEKKAFFRIDAAVLRGLK